MDRRSSKLIFKNDDSPYFLGKPSTNKKREIVLFFYQTGGGEKTKPLKDFPFFPRKKREIEPNFRGEGKKNWNISGKN